MHQLLHYEETSKEVAPANNKACSEHCCSLNVPQGERTGYFHIWLLLVGLNWACLILTHSVPHVSAYKAHFSHLVDAKTEERALKAAALLVLPCGVLFCCVFHIKNLALCKLGRAWGCSGPQSCSCNSWVWGAWDRYQEKPNCWVPTVFAVLKL